MILILFFPGDPDASARAVVNLQREFQNSQSEMRNPK